MLQLIDYYLLIWLIGVVTYPFTSYIFDNWKSGGWGFSKIIGLTIVCVSAWLVSLWTGLSLDWSIIAGLFILVILSSIFVVFGTRQKQSFSKLRIRKIVEEELIFIIFCLFFLLVRAGNPDIWHPVMGGEKFMDFAFINSIIRSNHVPPLDPWFVGKTINYYYMGHFLVAVTIRLSRVLPAYGYNLALAYIFGQTAIGIYSLASYLGLSKVIGMLTSVLAIISGNYAQIKVIINKINGGYVPINGWYWTASRVMPNHEINEFPFFTFLYADLHAHLIAFPLLVLVIALGITWLKDNKLSFKSGAITLLYSSFLLAFIRTVNTWDWPTCMAITTGFMILGIFFSRLKTIKIKLSITLLAVSFLLGLSWLFGIPFFKLYKTGPLGLAIFTGTKTTLRDYLLINGFFIVTGFIYLFSTVHWKQLPARKAIITLGLSIFSVIVSQRLGGIPLLPLFVIAGLISLLTLRKSMTMVSLTNLIAVALFISGIGLTLLPDIFYFNLGLGRMNMVFKFYLQAWFLFAISAGLMIWQIDVRLRNKTILKTILRLFFGILFLGTLSYPITAIPAKIGDRMGENQEISLDGNIFMEKAIYYDQNMQSLLRYDLEAIDWLNQNVIGSPTILEANTPSYRWGSRISVFTGLPTVIGWGWHEIAHRSYLPPSEITARENDVKLAYETQDPRELLAIVNKYDIQYIYVGDLERMYYDNSGLSKFQSMENSCLYKAYQNDSVCIYEVNQKCL